MKTWMLTGLCVLAIWSTPSMAQRDPMINEFQEKLLSLEAETPPFRHFAGVVIEDFQMTRAQGLPLGEGDLLQAQEEARALLALARSMADEAASMSEGLHLTPGIELDADMMYRVSAWELRRFFTSWIQILIEVQEANVSSPASYWQFTKEFEDAQDGYETARIYRLLANQQTVLERLLAMSCPE